MIASNASKRRRRAKPSTGVVLHRGISPGTGDPYAVIAIWHSTNGKTGDMVTVWIVQDDAHPVKAKVAGREHGTCLDCPLGMYGGCYVEVERAPSSIWRCYKNGGYEEYDQAKHDAMVAGRMVRWGGYGEPVLIPVGIVFRWSTLLAKGWTGYTHQWRRPEYQVYRMFFMASVHSLRQRDFAWSMGWRTFRDTASFDEEPIGRGEFNCPASDEQGNRMQCYECGACDGAERSVGEIQRASVAIKRHANAVETLRLNKALRLGIVSFDS